MIKQITYNGADYTLHCQHCEEQNLHHYIADIHHRPGGEDKETVTTRAYGPAGALTENPSGRRDGISIVLWCEQCAGETILTIYQHKGVTYLDALPGLTRSPMAQAYYDLED